MSKPSEEELLRRSMAGDKDALSELLLRVYDRLKHHIQLQIPAAHCSVISAEDVIQEAHTRVFRKIGEFRPQHDGSFFAWLKTIAENKLRDRVKAEQREKRPGGHRRVVTPQANSSIVTLIQVVAQDSVTPSRVAAGDEAGKAVHVGLSALSEDHRQALTLRYIDGLPVSEVAARMNRTEGSVHMLLNRAIKKLREQMGNRSRFLSS